MRGHNLGTRAQVPPTNGLHCPGALWQNRPVSHIQPTKPPQLLPTPTAWTLAGNESVTTNAAASETKKRVFILASHDAFWFVLATRDYSDAIPAAMIADLARGRVVRLSLFFG
jgi:hypothetical protein